MRVAWVALVAGCGFRTPGVANDVPEPPDAEADVGGFHVTQCPVEYNLVFAETSRYRLLTAPRPAWDHSETCSQDLVGATHLAVLETPAELAGVTHFVDTTDGIPQNMMWVGAVQLPTATAPRDNWFWFDGEMVTTGWGGVEPNDVGGDESDHEEQFVRIERSRAWLVDAMGNLGYGALCECDGKPVAANIADAIQKYRR